MSSMLVLKVLRKLSKETKAEVYLVGGFVREYLRNKKSTDIDAVVRGLSLRNVKKFLKRYGKVKEVRSPKLTDKINSNLLIFKAEGDDNEASISLPKRGKRRIPDSHNTLNQDAMFRDFKVNSMYLPVDFKSKKDVIDLVGGRKDINDRRITANGNASERFKESPIRMLRVISLASKTNYKVDDSVIKAIRECAHLISNCSYDSIRKEFNEIIMSKKPSKYMRLLLNTGLLRVIAPEIHRCVGVKQDSRYHKFDVFTHLIYTLDHCDKDLTLRLAGLLHDVGKPDTRHESVNGNNKKVTFHKHEMIGIKVARNFLKRMKYDNETINSVLNLVKFHMFHYTRDWTDSAVRKFIRKLEMPDEYLTEDKIATFPLFKLRSAERLGNGLKGIAITERQRDFEKKIIQVHNTDNEFKISDLKIDGYRIINEFNLKPDGRIGKILRHLYEKVLENEKLNNIEDLTSMVKSYINENMCEAKAIN